MKKFQLIIIIFFSLFWFNSARAATLYSGSATEVVYKGQTFVLDWYLNTENSNINLIDLKINYSPDTLRVVEVSPGNSIVSLWLQKPRFDSDGTISLTGGVPNGFNGANAPIFRSTFEAINTGRAGISLESASILRNDGQGTSEQLKFTSLEFPVIEENLMTHTISSVTHPDQNQWYRNRDILISFNRKQNTEYSFSFSSNADLFPDEVPESDSQVEYKNMPDRIYYFKLSSKEGSDNWQEAGVSRVQIDATPPEDFSPIISSDSSLFEGEQFVSFSTVDKSSGISHYKAKVGLFGRALETQSPHKLHKPLVGDNVVVTAYDKAGNSVTEIVAWPGVISVQMFRWLLILIGLSAIVLNKVLRNKILNLFRS